MNDFATDELERGLESGFVDMEANAKFEAGKDHAAQAAREMKEAAMLKAREVKNTAMNTMADARRRVESSVNDVRARCERSTREAPLNTLLTVFGAGFLLGFLLRK